MKKRVISLILAFIMLVLTLSLAACGDKQENTNENLDKEEDTKGLPFTITHYATIEIEDYGTIKLELYGEDAPISVNNFVTLANEGFYNGLTFHRIIEGFMMQGGGYTEGGTYKYADDITGEFSANGIYNPIKHERGVISMARAEAYNSGSSQFFIMHEKSEGLDGQYAAFGKVISGMYIVDKICTEIPQGYNGAISLSNRPVIKAITIEEVK